MVHPAYVLREQNKYKSDIPFVFELNLRRAFEEIEEGLPEPVIHSKEMALADLEIVTGRNGNADVRRITTFLDSLYHKKIVGFDYETNALRPYGTGSKILTVALGSDEKALAFPIHHKGVAWTTEQRAEVLHHLKQFLYKAECRKVVHNLAFEMEWTAYHFGRKSLRAGAWGDSVSQAYLLDERPGMHSLDTLCMQYFGFHEKEIDNLNKSKIDEEPLETVLRYNALDAKYHRLIYLAQSRRIKQEGMQEVYEHQLRRIPTLVLTQLKGVPVNQDVTDMFHHKFIRRMEKIEAKINELPIVRKFEKLKGKKYSPSNTYHMRYIVKDILKLKEEKVDESTLRKIDHPIARLTLSWRKADKLFSTYVEPFKKDSPTMWPDGLLQPVITSTRVRTWRTSSHDPNIQNQPKRASKETRSQVSLPGHLIVAFDYAGIQARNVAMESRDKTLVKAFWNNYDIHKDWMERIEKKCPGWIKGDKLDRGVIKAFRNSAKNGLVFATFFGAQPKKIATALGIEVNKAQELHEEFWAMFPDIKKWHNQLFIDYKQNGYVTGHSGHRRHAPVAPNEIINSPIQADESKIVLGAMCRLSEYEDPRYQANIEVHDDLTFIWPKGEVEKNMEVVIREMIHVEYDWINTPLVVEASVGTDWANLAAVGEYSSATIKSKDNNGGNWSDGTGWTAVDKRKR